MKYKDIEIYYTPGEVDQLIETLHKVKDVKGVLVEVGVFLGGSALHISETLPKRQLYLFDTFNGFPDDLRFDCGDARSYFVGDCAAPLEKVKKNLKDYPDIVITEGRFPDTGKILKDKKIAFAHIDVDIYTATKESLEFLYPKVVDGGYILIHDYPAHKGVERAVNEFMEDKKEEVEILGVEGRQALIKKQS